MTQFIVPAESFGCQPLGKKKITERDTRFYLLFVQKWWFSCLERDFSKYFFTRIFLFGANFQNSFKIYQFPIFAYTQKIKTTSPLSAIY